MLVAPLNWGLGHATRCIPIIHALIKADYKPILASDGDALLLLQKEFPLLKSYALPCYNIKYTKNGKRLKYKLFLSATSIISAVKKERKIVAQIIKKESIVGIISDNRFGVVSKKVPSVYITHQLKVLSGKTTFMTSKVHQKIMEQFDECWVPDIEKEPNYSAELGHLKKHKFKLKYLGVLSRFKPQKLEIKYDLLVLLSGPEPQRTLLEIKLLKELNSYKGMVLFVRGIFNSKTNTVAPANFKLIDYLLTNDLEKAINQSKIVIARSGYSTIMDLAVIGKKAFFIPTPGQFEQENLATMLDQKMIAPYSKQQDFKIDKLKELNKYKGFSCSKTKVDLQLFNLFEGE